MKTFRVVKRGPWGTQEEAIIEAESREALQETLKKQNATVAKIEEIRGRRGSKGNSRAKGVVSGMLIALAIVFAGGITIWLATKSNDQAQQGQKVEKAKKSGAISEVEPELATEAKEEVPVVDESAIEREKRKAAYKAMTPDERWEYVVERAEKSALREEPSSNRIFRTSTEQVMDWIFRCEVGDPPPLLPELPIKEQLHLAEILISDNPIKADDSDNVKEAKETVQLAKKEFQEFIREGGEPEEFLAYYHSQLVQAHEEWKTARKMAIEAIKEDPDIAADYIERLNEHLAEKGIKKIKLPPKMLEHYGIELTD